MTGVDSASFTRLYGIDIKQGGDAAVRSLARPGTVMVGKSFADSNGLDVGSRAHPHDADERQAGGAGRRRLRRQGRPAGQAHVRQPLAGAAFGERKDAFGLVGVRPGQDVKVVERRVKGLLDRDFPSTEVLTAKEFKDQQAGQVNQLLGLIYALLFLAIIVSLFGIVNTLVLSISERTRELGMLRAIGMSRRQVKRMMRWEAVITSLIGGVVGGGAGERSWRCSSRRPLDGFVLSDPGGHAARPARAGRPGGRRGGGAAARRAARLDVLDALAYE